ncbi:MAG: MaoC family dehydratase [Actinomycetota bacterium]
MRRLVDVAVGEALPERVAHLDQERVLRYAGASGDYNRLHWDPAFAARVSPTGAVIAHGMLSLGLLSAAVTDWAGGPEHVRSLSASFRAPCPVEATLRLGGEVLEIDAEAATATLAVWAALADGAAVIDRRRSRAVVALDPGEGR